MPNGTKGFAESSWSDAMKEVERKAVALDERRMKQINRQVESINRLLQRLNAFEAFCETQGLEDEAKAFVEKWLADAAAENDPA